MFLKAKKMIFWEKNTWLEIKEKLPHIKAVILPVGSIEQHGPHLPLGCDTIGAYKLSQFIASALKEDVLVLPPIYYGVSEHHMDFPGTITISADTLIAIVYEIGVSLHHFGVKKMIIINGHGGNVHALSIAIRKISEKLGMQVVLINPWELINDIIEKTLETKIWGHACEFETSLAMVEMPELVRYDKIIDPNIKKPGIKYVAIWEKNRVHVPWRTRDFTDTGSIGFPSKATKEKGEKLWKAMLDRTLEFVRSFIQID